IKTSGRSRPVFQVVKSCFSGSRKNTWKRWIDLALYLVSCALLGTGLLLAYRFPHGHGAGRMATFLGYARHEWGTIHTSLAWVAIFLVVFHLKLRCSHQRSISWTTRIKFRTAMFRVAFFQARPTESSRVLSAISR